MLDALAAFDATGLRMIYQLDPGTGQVGLVLLPDDTEKLLAPRREFLDEPALRPMPMPWHRTRAWQVESLVQAQCTDDERPRGYAQGMTLRGGGGTLGLRFESQVVHPEEDGRATLVETTLRDVSRGRRAVHRLRWRVGQPVLESSVEFVNEGRAPLTLELLASFTLGGLTPFASDDAPGRLTVHRLRSLWSAEGRLVSDPAEHLHLERAWQGHRVACERFGQVGTMPVRGWFPFVALEDTQAGVCWGAQLAWAGSWQMEVYRRGDCLALGGGLADREFGHWTKTLAPGEGFETPTAFLSAARGDVDDLCARLLVAQERVAAAAQPTAEWDLPVVCNDFCATWGNPTHARLLALADRLREAPEVRYLVIDAGWYAGPHDSWLETHGDWQPGAGRFPAAGGLAATARAIRERGLIPGLWFEPESCGAGSESFTRTSHLLHRDGVPITVGGRRFWDLRDPAVHEFLAARVIGRLRDDGFGYVKLDHNETLGLGCDHPGPDAPGEGLRRQVEASLAFLDRLRAELPELVVETCASGGHRLEPSVLARCAMGSFSDAHETPELPILAANLHRVTLPRQTQIWAVLRATDTERRMVYTLAAGFLGRMCLSGEVDALSDAQWDLARRALRLYRAAAPVIRCGRTRRHGPPVPSYRHPVGWQAVVRVGEDEDTALVVTHSFGEFTGQELRLPLPGGAGWSVTETLRESGGDSPRVEHDILHVPLPGEFAAMVLFLRRQIPKEPAPSPSGGSHSPLDLDNASISVRA